jgi:hypothetical protein
MRKSRLFLKCVLLTIVFLFLFQPLSKADIIQYNDAFPYAFYGDNYTPGYCLTTYETLQNDVIYLCKKVHVVPVPRNTGTRYSPEIYGRGYCWQSSYGGWWGGYGNSQNLGTGVTLSQVHQYYGSSPPPFDSNKICVKKSEVSPEACDLNIRSIVNGAFSNKFPLDLFTNFVSENIPNACPSFTIENQTFQLCYINTLTRSLKYVLLLIFIIGSVIAL